MARTSVRSPQVMPATAVPAGLLDTPQGLQFLTNKGKPAKKGTDTGGFVVPEEGVQYRLTNLRGKNQVVASGTGAEGLQSVFDASQNLSQTQGKKANWEAERLNPDTGQWERIAFDPRGGLKGALSRIDDLAGDVALGAGVGALGVATGGLGFGLAPAMIGGGLLGGALNTAGVNVTDVALPVAANFALPGLGPVLATGLGSAASSVLQGRGLEETLLRAGISAGTAGLLDATGASSAIGNAVSDALSPAVSDSLSPAVSSVAESAADSTLAPAIGDIIVNANPLAASIGSAASSAIGGGAGSIVGGNILPPETPTPSSTTPQGETGDVIEVVGPRPTTPPNLETLLGPVATIPGGLTDGNILPPETPTPSSTTPQGETGDVIEVVAERPPINVVPLPDLETLLGPVATIPGGLTDGNILPSDKPADTTSTMQDIQTWLNRAGLASTVLGVLGDAVGGTGGAGALTPYTSVLGPAPSFGRGAFTPYTGNYETYGFGPEFSFFGQAPAQTTTGPMASLLNPALPVNNTLLA